MKKISATCMVAVLFLAAPSITSAQMKVASWISFNPATDLFPIEASETVPAIVGAARLNSKGLKKLNTDRSSLKSENTDKEVNLLTTPYVSYTLQLLTTTVNFDKFVLQRFAIDNKATRTQLRWSVDGFATGLGSFKTAGENVLSLSSVNLSSLPPVSAKEIEFRIYYYNAPGIISRADTGTFVSADQTAATYSRQDGFASIWVKDATVPIRIEQFRGRNEGTDIQLKWQTAAAQNISHFEIERSTDGVTFYNAGRVNALEIPTAVNKYHFTDRTTMDLLTDILFYRLWMLDSSGNASYSSVIPVLTKKNEAVGFVFPNQEKDVATIVINSKRDETVRYTIYDSKYRKMLTGRHALQQGSNVFNVPVTEIPSGAYTLQVGGTKLYNSLRFVK